MTLSTARLICFKILARASAEERAWLYSMYIAGILGTSSGFLATDKLSQVRDAIATPLHFTRSTIPKEIIEGLLEIYLSKDLCSFERLSRVTFDWEIRISDFTIEREIRKRISPPRNPSSCWISIKKSKSGFHGFSFYCSIGKSEKRIAKIFS